MTAVPLSRLDLPIHVDMLCRRTLDAERLALERMTLLGCIMMAVDRPCDKERPENADRDQRTIGRELRNNGLKAVNNRININ